MNDKKGKYEINPESMEFLNRKFDKTAVDATIKELAEFAFGGLDAAIQAYEK